MKKMFVLVLAVCLALAIFAGCSQSPSTPSTAPDESAAPAESAVPDESAAPAEDVQLGVMFEDKGNNVVYGKDVPEPGLAFPISTSGDFAVECYAVDANGEKLGDIEVADGTIDYSEYAGQAAKVVVVGGAVGGTYEYEIPIQLGVMFEDKGNNVVYGKDVPEPGLAFPISTSGDFAVECYAVDANGQKLGDIEVTDGTIDYSEYAGQAAKVVVVGGAVGGTYEYEIPSK